MCLGSLQVQTFSSAESVTKGKECIFFYILAPHKAANRNDAPQISIACSVEKNPFPMVAGNSILILQKEP